MIDIVPEEIKALLTDLEKSLYNDPNDIDWGTILQGSDLYEAELTHTLVPHDTSDFVVKDYSNGYWLFVADGNSYGWNVHYLGNKVEYRWDEEMLGVIEEDFNIALFEVELKYNLPGVDVVKVEGVLNRTEFEETFKDVFDKAWESALNSACL